MTQVATSTARRRLGLLGAVALGAALVACSPASSPAPSASGAARSQSPSARPSATSSGVPVEVIAGSSGPFDAPRGGPSGPTGFAGDGGPATKAKFDYLVGIAVDDGGTVYVVDQGNNRVRRISSAGIIDTVAGSGLLPGFAGDGGPATSAVLNQPEDVAVDAQGNLYIADSGNNRIRKVDRNGIISTIAGTGEAASTGDGAAAAQAAVDTPDSVALAADGTLFVSGPSEVRRIGLDGVIQTVAGDGTVDVAQPPWTADSFAGDGRPATAARFTDASDMRVGPDGNLYMADFLDCRVLMIDAAGLIHVVAGTGCSSFNGTSSGDGGPANHANLARPVDVAFGPDRRLYVLEHYGQVRIVDQGGMISTLRMAWTYEEPLGMAITGDELYITDRDHMAVIRLQLPPAGGQ